MNMKRILSFMLAFIMVLSLVPAVRAAETQLAGLNVSGLTVTHGDTMYFDADKEALLKDKSAYGSLEYQASATGITVRASSDGDQVGATLSFKNTLDIPATLRFDYSFEQDPYEAEDAFYPSRVLGLSGGSFEQELKSGETYTITVISPEYNFDAAVLTIYNLSLSTGGAVTVTFKPAENGSYQVNGTAITAEQSFEAEAGTKYAVEATAASGYCFFGWYNGTTYLSYEAKTEIPVGENQAIWPVFIKDTVAVFGVGIARFQSLTEADAYAKNGAVKTIILMNDGILTGEHTISAGNTLLIPYDAANTVHTVATSTAIPPENEGGPWTNVEWDTPCAYRTMTMAPGAMLTVKGSLNVGGRHSAGPFLTAGSPSGDLGMIQMAAGSNIAVENGGTVYCWGYIYGDGKVTVENGGIVHENFQFSDFRGGNITLGLATSFLVFPISQYYVQNIEVATTFKSGATEYVWGGIYLQNQVLSTSVKFIGNDNLSMFVPGANGTVTKTYDPATDRLIIDISGDGSINPMGLELGGHAIDTATFVLPINSNMTININSGTTALYQSLALLPGVKLTIAENATLSLKSREPLKYENGQYVHYTGANNLIVYDRDQWFNAYQPIYDDAGALIGANPVEVKFVYTNNNFKRLQPVAWSPTRTGSRTEAHLVDAVVDINGQLITDGFIYTTLDVDLLKFFTGQGVEITGGGAAVTSSKGTGKLVMNNGSGGDSITLQPYQNSDNVEYAYLLMASARLQNRDGSYVDTLDSAAGAAFKFCTECGRWYSEADTHTVDITWIVNGVDGTQEVCGGTQPVFNGGNDPVKDGCTFIGWSTGNDNVPEYTSENLPVATEDTVYYACFEENAAAGLLGDLNLDGKVNSDDLTLLARHVGKIETLTDAQALENADVNGDGTIDSDDLTKHARYVGKIITDWSQN